MTWSERAWPIAKAYLTPIVILVVLTVVSGCAACSSEDLASRAAWGAPLAVVDQAGFAYRAGVVPVGPLGIPSVVTWGVPCRLPDRERQKIRACTPAESADPNGPVCYVGR